MVKTIDTLVEDIGKVLENGSDVSDDFVRDMATSFARLIKNRLSTERGEPSLRMSNIGSPCNRKLWYTMNAKGEREKLDASTKFKFLFGDIIEEVVLFLAKVAGHKVEGEQGVLEIEGIKGHRDAVIDGVVVDVKSASSFSFNKFKNHTLSENDAFGYEDQLQSYMYASKNDPLVIDKTRGAFLAVDKQLGHMVLDVHEKKDFPYDELYKFKKSMVKREDPPEKSFHLIPEGKSGNMKLGVNCSYCEFKKLCYPNIRTFLYSNKPG